MLFLSKSNAKRRVTSQFTKFSKASHFLEYTTPRVDFELLKLDMIQKLYVLPSSSCPLSSFFRYQPFFNQKFLNKRQKLSDTPDIGALATITINRKHKPAVILLRTLEIFNPGLASS